jgi:hypothetical protein
LSALTRVFVILLVVCSLLMSAGVIVFVNRSEDYRQTVSSAEANARASEHNFQSKLNESNQLRAEAEAREVAASGRIAAIQKDLASAQQQLAERGVQAAEASKNLSLAQVQLTGATQALRASEETKAQLLNEQQGMRGTLDRLTRANTELNSSVSDLTNKLEVTERERRFLAEQLAEAQNQVNRQASALKGAGVSEQQAQNAPVAAPSINGVINAIRPINGIQYATISVGSAEGVKPGVEFKVIDRNAGQYLGTLRVDQVEPHEAIGRLDGPGVANVKPGNEVRTQL